MVVDQVWYNVQFYLGDHLAHLLSPLGGPSSDVLLYLYAHIVTQT